MKLVFPVSFLLIGTAACITVWFVSVLRPTSTGAFVVFTAWLLLPYVIMGTALVVLKRARKDSGYWHAVSAIVSAGGIVFLTDTIFWHPHAQGGIAVFFTPVYQGIAFALLSPVAWWMSRDARS